MEALMLVAGKNGPTMLAQIGFMRALNRHVVRDKTNHKTPIGESGSWARDRTVN
jgi:hypothetical protein